MRGVQTPNTSRVPVELVVSPGPNPRRVRFFYDGSSEPAVPLAMLEHDALVWSAPSVNEFVRAHRLLVSGHGGQIEAWLAEVLERFLIGSELAITFREYSRLGRMLRAIRRAGPEVERACRMAARTLSIEALCDFVFDVGRKARIEEQFTRGCR